MGRKNKYRKAMSAIVRKRLVESGDWERIEHLLSQKSGRVARKMQDLLGVNKTKEEYEEDEKEK